MEQAHALSVEDALRFRRSLGGDEELLGFRMAAMSGNSPAPLASLAEVERFFVVLTQEEIGSMDMRQRIHYIDPSSLVAWVRDVVGDVDLARSLNEVVSGGDVYGTLVRDMKPLIAERLGEYEAVLGEDAQVGIE